MKLNMKARLKTNGEIVEVEDLYDDGTALVKDRYFKVSELDFEDFETIDWEQRRYEIAKAAMQANLSNPEILQFITKEGVPIERVAKCSIQYADALIKELKKGD
jgi:hypothetical protein|nr:MAG TPA: hypothetical protein [Caudoviricetes sp.]